MAHDYRWTEADVVAHLVKHGLPHTPTLKLATETPEGTLLADIRKLAQAHSFLSYHTYDSRKSAKGFPDLVLARPASSASAGRLIIAELKSTRGKLSGEQAVWLNVLRHTLPGLEVEVWTPHDWPHIVQSLTRRGSSDQKAL